MLLLFSYLHFLQPSVHAPPRPPPIHTSLPFSPCLPNLFTKKKLKISHRYPSPPRYHAYKPFPVHMHLLFLLLSGVKSSTWALDPILHISWVLYTTLKYSLPSLLSIQLILFNWRVPTDIKHQKCHLIRVSMPD